MDFERFEQIARQDWERIPPSYKAGVDGLLVERSSKRHPSRAEVFTLGECVTETYPSDWGGPDTTRSWLLLHYGSFRGLAARSPEFDWEHEIWETLTHELRHHLESLAADDALEAFDYAVDENFKRHDGEPFDAFFYRSGEPIGEALYQVEDERFHEIEYRQPAAWIEIEVDDVAWRVEWPAVEADVVFLELDELIEPPGLYTLVLVRRARPWEVLTSLVRGRRARIAEERGRATRRTP